MPRRLVTSDISYRCTKVIDNTVWVPDKLFDSYFLLSSKRLSYSLLGYEYTDSEKLPLLWRKVFEHSGCFYVTWRVYIAHENVWNITHAKAERLERMLLYYKHIFQPVNRDAIKHRLR